MGGMKEGRKEGRKERTLSTFDSREGACRPQRFATQPPPFSEPAAAIVRGKCGNGIKGCVSQRANGHRLRNAVECVWEGDFDELVRVSRWRHAGSVGVGWCGVSDVKLMLDIDCGRRGRKCELLPKCGKGLFGAWRKWLGHF
jgi:hypothetical protein